jgi:hypothetical protein
MYGIYGNAYKRDLRWSMVVFCTFESDRGFGYRSCYRLSFRHQQDKLHKNRVLEECGGNNLNDTGNDNRLC